MTARYRSFTALWLGGAGDLVVRHAYGRQGIWYAQPQAGQDYPLVTPSADVRYLFADIHLSYAGYSEAASSFVLPFRLHWAYGFGSTPSSTPDPETPAPAHEYDIIIVDAEDAVVFDSTAEDSQYESRAWTAWLRITRWELPDGSVCSTVHHTAWSLTDTPPVQNYPRYFFPERAILQEQTVYRLPNRVTSIVAILDSLTAKNVTLSGGYNMGLTLNTATATAGGRRVTGITFDAVPGAGSGVYVDCAPTDNPVRTINAVPPTDAGHFFINAAGCYYARRPMRVLSESPRLLLPETELAPGNQVEEDLPDDTAGLTAESPGWPATTEYAHLQLGNDCGACCDCEDYTAVAEYIQLQHSRYAQLGRSFSNTRDQYHANRSQWLAARDCLQQSPVRVVVQAQQCPYVDIGVQVCNQTAACMTDIAVTVTITTVPAGGVISVVPGYTYTVGPTVEAGIQRVTTRRSAIELTADTLTTVIEQLAPGGSSVVRFRLSVAGCGGVDIIDTGYQVTAAVTATINDVPINATPVTDSDILNCPPVVTIPAPQCIRC